MVVLLLGTLSDLLADLLYTELGRGFEVRVVTAVPRRTCTRRGNQRRRPAISRRADASRACRVRVCTVRALRWSAQRRCFMQTSYHTSWWLLCALCNFCPRAVLKRFPHLLFYSLSQTPTLLSVQLSFLPLFKPCVCLGCGSSNCALFLRPLLFPLVAVLGRWVCFFQPTTTARRVESASGPVVSSTFSSFAATSSPAPPSPSPFFPPGTGASLIRSLCLFSADLSCTSLPTLPLNPFPALLVRPLTTTSAPTTYVYGRTRRRWKADEEGVMLSRYVGAQSPT